MAVTETAVEREVRVEAAPEVVFEYFVDSERMVRWMGVEATLDPSPGGIFRVDINGRHVARGRYVEIVPSERVVFTWGWEDDGHPVPPESSTVEVELVPDGAATIVRLRHYGLADDEQRTNHAHGWEHYLERLTAAGAGRDPGRDSFLDLPSTD
jgi:uncharacterized protein YndB with AHSA1/START domain